MSRIGYVCDTIKIEKKILNKIKAGKKLTEKESADLYNGIKVFLAGRGGGKTIKIIEECRKNNGLLVTMSEHEAERLANSGLIDRRNIAVYGSGPFVKPGDYRALYIDNADLILERLFGQRIAMVTMSRSRNE